MKNQITKNRVNEEITSAWVRIVNFDENLAHTVSSREDALETAEMNELDLIEIAVDKDKDISICKMMELDKFLYQEKKKAKALKASQNKSEQKEIKLGVDIAENDFNVKVSHARKFLEKGDRVKVTLQLRGRRLGSQVIKDNAKILVLKFVDTLSDVGKTNSLPEWQGNRLFIQINPK